MSIWHYRHGIVVTPPPPGAAFVRQLASVNFPGQPGDSQSQNRSVSLTDFNVLAGSAIVVFGTMENEGTAIQVPDLTDTLNGVYAAPKEKTNDVASPLGLLSAYTWLFPNSAAGALRLDAFFLNLEWQGLCILEVAGVKAAPYIASSSAIVHSFNSAAADGLSAGTMVGGGKKAIVLAMGQSISDFGTALGGSGLGRPNQGTGFSIVTEVWNLNHRENTSDAPSAMIQTRSFSSMGTVDTTFTGTGGANDDFNLHTIALESAA